MGMNISSSSAMNVFQSAQSSGTRAQRHQQFDALAQALKAGDASAANTAYTSIMAQFPSGMTPPAGSPLAKIGDALKSGDLASALAAVPQRPQRAAANSSQASTNGATNLFDLPPPPTDGDGDADGSASGVDPFAASNSGSSASTSSASTSSATSTDPLQVASSASGQKAGQVGHHHHHHGGGSPPPTDPTAQATSQSSGDVSTASFLDAKVAMAKLIDDLKSLVSSNPSADVTASTQTGTTATPSSAATAASNLLNNPDFQNLATAVNGGDTSSIKTAWDKFIQNTFAANASEAAGAESSTVSALA
jgi:hypothetical protein